ncbi:efflux RND transporter periplasmic adaptor subunit [Chitinophaga sp. LS1]|uniref:efflux RND transporter periplasmic adaptor subunit n=1 Tax=Chitinophaga sp. LS1 TaxID=3051176 RepID=UPI002AABC581|nr:HlyD family efflux transporter periplasmic adaptor subunit [Chitinophaga sp. LS1]WPV64760.1 HlyD family efflux transporter periplasmic adaptor subunit [Chitinophaga sp. LS1]
MKHIFIISFAGITLLSSCKSKNSGTAAPIYAPITEAIFAPGHIEAGGQFTLTALNDGYITDVPVIEGDTVTNGQTIFKQDNTTAAIAQRSATENLAIARQNASDNSAVLAQLQQQLNTATEKLANDLTQRDRNARLYATRSVAKVDYDNAELAYQSSMHSVEQLKQNIAATKLSLQQTLINSRKDQETAMANTSYYNIKSPGNYTVYTLLKRKGDLVRKGDALAILGNAGGMLISLSIDEGSIAKIKPGQTVLTELNTEKGKTYTGHVSKIYPSFDEQSQAYTIEATFDTLPAGLMNGTLLQSNIIVAHKDKALLVPANCVSPDGRALIKHRKQTDTIQLKTGIVSTDYVEVLGGINADDKLIKAY